MTELTVAILGAIDNRTYFNGKRKYSKKKRDIITHITLNNLIRTSEMFEWKGLPETIPQRILELIIQTWGFVGVFEYQDKLYCSWGTLGGTPNYNYMPSVMIVANPHLVNKEFQIYGKNKDIVVIPNDTLYRGLVPIFTFNSELLCEIQLTKKCVITNMRTPAILTAPSNNSKKDLDDYLKSLDEGEIASIQAKNLYNSIQAIQFSEKTGANPITQLIEIEQYQKSCLYNDLGLQSNYNMKRESITSSENMLNTDMLLPLVDNMLKMRQNACEEINTLFNTNISVDFNSAWKLLRDKLNAEQNILENETKQENQTSENDQNEDGGKENENEEKSS